ncbi:MAG: hypothetical protein V3U30_03460 [Thermoplasmata archaeon]
MAAVAKSQEGLNLVGWSLLLYVVLLVAGLASSGAFLFLAITGRFDFTTGVTFAAGVANPTLLLSLVLVILFLIGFFTLYSQRRELGPRHKRSMDRSLLLFIGLIVAFVALLVVVVVMFFMAYRSFLFDPGLGEPPIPQSTLENLQRALLPGLLVWQGLNILVACLIGLLLFSMVAALFTPQQQSRLRLAAALLILGSVANFVTFIVLYRTDNLLVPVFQNVSPLIYPPLNMWYQDVVGSLLGYSLQLVAASLFWRAYRTSYRAMRTTQLLAK